NPDGSYTYTPDPDYNGGDSFTVTVDDGHGGTTTSTVDITVTPVNDPPETVGTVVDQSNEDADGVTGLDVSTYFHDIDSSALTYSATGLPSGLTIDPATGLISGTIDHSASQGGTDGVYTVTVTADDGDGGTVDQTFTWTVTNPAPLAQDDTATTNEDTAVNGNVLTNDSDPDGDPLKVTTFAVAGDATTHTAGDTVHLTEGDLTLNADGSYSFTPAADWNGAVPTVTYTISDGEGGTATAHLDITVTPVNDPPVIDGGDHAGVVIEAGNLDDGTVVPGTPSVSGTLNAHDVDGDALAWSVVGTPDATYGSFGVDPATGKWTYTLDNSLAATQALNEGQTVPLQFTVQVGDGHGGTATQTIDVTITGTNDSPVADVDTGAVTESGVKNGGNTPEPGIATASGNVLGNDSDVDAGDTLHVSDVSFGGAAGTVGTALVGTYGSLVLNADGTYSYTLDNGDPDTQALKQGATATEVFTYTAIDAHGATSTSTLTITVHGTNDQPTITSGTADAQGDVTEQGATNPTEADTTTGTLAASDVDTDATQAWSIAGTGTYGTIGIDPATGKWTYTLDNSRAATQALNDGDTKTETFTARVTDEHGAYSEQVVTVTVHGSNDAPTGTSNASVTLNEDNAKSGTLQDYVHDVDDTLAVTGFKVDTNGDGTPETFNPGDTATIKDSAGNTLGTLTIAANGDYTFTPAANYAGNVPTVTYTMQEQTGGLSLTQTLDFGITKVSDAPTLDAATTVHTNEDTAVSLGLHAPVITDTGMPGAAAAADNDYSERLGAITLAIGGAGANGVTLSTGATTLTPHNDTVTVVLTDVPHTTSVPAEDHANGIYYLTTAEYEALVANPAAENGKNFTVTVGATSYEVDSAGAIISGVAGAPNSQVVTVDVQAVTDGADLALVGSPTAAQLTFKEDATLNLSSYLHATLTSTDANPGNDTDGSEKYWYTVSGLPQGTVVSINGTNYTAGSDGTVTSSQSSTFTAAPTITVKPPSNYSGDINGVTITLHTKDTDTDSTGTINETTSPVTLNLHVTPVAGDVSVGNVSTKEDTAVAFLGSLKDTDTGTTHGTEVINSVSFTVPTGWTMTAPAAVTGAHYTLDTTTGNATISFDDGVSETVRENYLHGFTITPPGNDSNDKTIALSITSTDINTVNGATSTDTATVSKNVTVTVTPVAERTDGDTNHDSTADVQMHGNETYTGAIGKEDAWFALGTNYTGASNSSGGHDLASGWSNQDADEFTYAALKPVLVSGGDAAAGDSAIGSEFRYSTDGGTTWVTQTYTGDAIWVPKEYLDTLQYLASPNVSGTFQIQVQAVTVDYDDDSEKPAPTDPIGSGTGVDVQYSGTATLDGIVIQPVADPVTMSLNGHATGLEDTAIPLAVKVTSSDPSEIFNVTIKDIPVGATITYGTGASVQTFTATAGNTSFEIDDFSNTAPLTITPPANSNVGFPLTVDAISVDGGSTSDTASRVIDVSVTGVADTPVVTLAPAYHAAEETLDSGDHKVALSNLVTSVTSPDTDGSETTTMRITGLAEGFSVSGATMVTSGTGTERVWMVSADHLADASIVAPENYSGTVNFKVAGVTTENDGDSYTGSPTNVSFTVTPSPEATIDGNATLVEDQVTPLNLSIQYQNGDTDETLGKVFMPVDPAAGSHYTLYLNGVELSAAGLTVTTIDGKDYYEIPADKVDELGAKGALNLDGDLGSLDFKYEVVDPSSDGTLAATTVTNSGSLALTATPMTDPVHASITAIDMTSATGTTADNTAGDHAAPDTATVTHGGAVTVNLHVDSDDTDGSEHLIRVLVEGVPEGVTVDGASQVGAGSWLLVYDGGDAKSIGAGGTDVPVQFLIGAGASSGTNTITMTTQAQDEGQSATTPAGVESDSVQWKLVLDLGPGGTVYPPPTIDEWNYNGATGTEDTPFKLGDAVDAHVTTSDATVPYSYTVTVTDLPAGSEVDGMILTTIGGVPTWTATVTVPAGGDSQAALENLLAGITITPPADSNDNNANFGFDAHLAAAAAAGGPSAQADTVADMPVTPVTDKAVVTVAASDVDEGTHSVTATLSAHDTADGSYGQIVDGKLYVQVSTTHNDGGTVSSDGTDLALTHVTGVSGIADGDYYVVDVGTAGGSVDLTYTAADGIVLAPGDVTFTASTQTQETGASNVEAASGSGTADVVIINNGVTVTSTASSGNEAATPGKNNAIQLAGLTVALNDNDGSESIHSILLSHVPVGFLIFVGDNAGDATLATQASNAGSDGTSNTWVLSDGGPLPAYVAILPAAHWSGTLSDLALVVESGESSLSTTKVETIPLADMTVNAVANGITIDPTISFGTEGHIIDLNLNASMADPVASTVAGDASHETTTLQIVGLGEHAGFYIGSDPVDAAHVAYDAATDTYTVTGLSQDNLDDLGFVQAASALTDQDAATSGTQLSVTAWTVESDGTSTSAHVTDTLTVAETKVTATTGNDSFIWDGEAINGKAGNDTMALRQGEDASHTDLASKLSNVESIDLSAPGANGITGGLSIDDVLSITGHNAGNASSAVLNITGTSDDSVVLSSTSDWTQSSTATDGYYTFANTDGAKVLIDEDIVNNHHVSYAA
ncbi:MAG TPA: VCBS domain-containing protein, partial [Rhodanobacter sp.]